MKQKKEDNPFERMGSSKSTVRCEKEGKINVHAEPVKVVETVRSHDHEQDELNSV